MLKLWLYVVNIKMEIDEEADDSEDELELLLKFALSLTPLFSSLSVKKGVQERDNQVICRSVCLLSYFSSQVAMQLISFLKHALSVPKRISTLCLRQHIPKDCD